VVFQAGGQIGSSDASLFGFTGHTRVVQSSQYESEREYMMNRQDIQLVQEASGHPSLTISLPTHRTAPDNFQDPIRVRNLVAQAKERLRAEFSNRELAPLLERLDKLSESID
jgi:hypothetical protein